MNKMALILPLVFVSTGTFAFESASSIKGSSEYTSMAYNLENEVEKISGYNDLSSNFKCIMEFAWGLNTEELEAKGKVNKLAKNPHRLLKDHYIDVAKAGIEVSLNAYKAKNLVNANWCRAAFDGADNDAFERERETCTARLKAGDFGDFPNLDYENYAEVATAFSVLDSKYISQLPFSNENLENLLGSCIE
ncbi:hypothetical protein ACXITX_23855 [Vibrio parahaemolyticus]|uniref:hypothetical protein n=1 Tax=Vibrio parahaemolyticus TaxID=670 RepID=UPI000448C24B|nr:hypothetical protein [Vibrio parahaemolyticus]EXJ25646.1 hypothetical protein D050_4792 [Vibrio parahaemolyticus VPCR-2009]MBE3775492.1 hypothetical protein [Vibrio parahaemolyticus]MBE4300671.1 hypothetical protein [Vibrio parahaemolyticus]MBE4305106.1 hypothetical protein [Vibrio parahaemolyticus]MBE4463055.1 hypothetical protein [Vibrio parahaemolyticus]